MPTLKNRQRVGLGDFSGVRRQQPMRKNGCSLNRLFLAGILSQLYELYADLSSKMMAVIGRFTPEQHVYSIDESFLSFAPRTKAIPCLRSHGAALRKAVWRECRLPVCVGFGSTLTLAKVANHAAKNIAGYAGVCVLDTERERKAFNVELERTVRELNGQSCKTWDVAEADKKQIFSTRSFGERIEEEEALRQALCQHAGIASRKARQQGSLCKVLLCFAASSPFDASPYSQRALHRFAYPTADATHLTKVVSELAAKLFVPGVRFYKVGVGLLDLVDGRQEQADLFNPAPNNAPLMAVFDGLNKRYGQNTLFLAAQGIEQKWQMRREFLTPQ